VNQMAATTLLDAEVTAESAVAPAQTAPGTSPLSGSQRRCILIAAAATAAVGAPVRILDVRPAPVDPVNRWTRAGRAGRQIGRGAPVLRRGAVATHEAEPGEGDQIS